MVPLLTKGMTSLVMLRNTSDCWEGLTQVDVSFSNWSCSLCLSPALSHPTGTSFSANGILHKDGACILAQFQMNSTSLLRNLEMYLEDSGYFVLKRHLLEEEELHFPLSARPYIRHTCDRHTYTVEYRHNSWRQIAKFLSKLDHLLCLKWEAYRIAVYLLLSASGPEPEMSWGWF